MHLLLARKRKRSVGRYFVLLFIAVSFLFFLFSFFLGGGKDLVSPLVSGKISAGKNNPTLGNIVLGTLEGTKGTYAISIKNLKTGETYQLNEHRSFEAGSLYKLWVMATAFKQIQEGILKEDEVLSSSISALNNEFNIDPNVAELTEGGITLTVSSALNQMITISHNYAALLLTKKIKLSNVDAFLKDTQLNESKVGIDQESPFTTAYDTALFFEKLYKGNLGNEENTNKMLDLLKNQKLEKKLPKYLPEEIEIAHKTGEIGPFSHDSGIVYSQKGDYIIALLSETDIPAAAEDRLAQISKAIYEYFNKK